MKNNTKKLFEQEFEKVPTYVKKFVRKSGKIGAKIKKLIKDSGKTQKQFAEELNIKESQLSNIIAGNNFTLKTIVKIEDALNKEIIFIENPKPETNVTVFIDNPANAVGTFHGELNQNVYPSGKAEFNIIINRKSIGVPN
jgi:transcriptional regulator with XRE-family HTH domain